MKVQKTMNRHQKAAHRPGERRVRRDEIDRMLELANSTDPRKREEAAEALCPWRVRRRIEPVWDALYRLMEDSDVRVRRKAWHTLEDGGCPSNPAMNTLIDRALKREKDKQVRRFVDKFAAPRIEREKMASLLAGKSPYDARGKCDFCGSLNVRVRTDIETMIPAADGSRLALICRSCDT